MSAALGLMARSPSQRDDDLANEIIREADRLATNRGNYESHWDEIARRMWPEMRGGMNAFNFRNQGEKRMIDVFDSTPVLALQRFAAIVASLLFPSNQRYQGLRASDPSINKDREVRLWFEEATHALFNYRYAENANFEGQALRVAMSLGAFGPGIMYTDESLTGSGFRYKQVSIGQCYIAENHQGIVDTNYRRYKMTARQAVQKFNKRGDRELPDQIKDAMKTSPETEFDFIHCVRPNSDRDPSRADFAGMEFSEYYVSVTGKALIREKGYNSFPYAVPRYQGGDNELYGRSPAMDALPASKTLNEMQKAILKQGHRALDPVLIAHDDGVIDGFSQRPGALNPGGVSADGRPLIHALPTGNVQASKELLDDQRSTIKDIFLVNLFLILVETPQMTATEVLERAKEKGMLIAPNMGPVGNDFLGATTHRELDILMLQRKLRPMPPLLREAKGEYKIFYDNPLSRAQRAQEAAAAARWLEQGIAVFNATQNPEVFDFMDFDVIMPAIADIGGVPESWKRTMDQVKQIRQGRAQQQRDQQMIQAAPAAAAVAKSAAAMHSASKGSM